MIKSELDALSGAQLFQLCAAHRDRDDYWAEFLRRYHSLLTTSVYFAYGRFDQARLHANPLVPEIIQEVYLHILSEDCRLLRDFRGGSEKEAEVYLARVAINVTTDRLRSDRAQKRWAETVPLDEFIRQEEGGGRRVRTIGSVAERPTVSRMIEAFLRAYPGPTPRRDLLITLLHAQDGLTPEEIAGSGVFDLQPDSVRTVITRTKARLKKIFEG